MPPPKRPKAGGAWMNELFTANESDENVSQKSEQSIVSNTQVYEGHQDPMVTPNKQAEKSDTDANKKSIEDESKRSPTSGSEPKSDSSEVRDGSSGSQESNSFRGDSSDAVDRPTSSNPLSPVESRETISPSSHHQQVHPGREEDDHDVLIISQSTHSFNKQDVNANINPVKAKEVPAISFTQIIPHPNLREMLIKSKPSSTKSKLEQDIEESRRKDCQGIQWGSDMRTDPDQGQQRVIVNHSGSPPTLEKFSELSSQNQYPHNIPSISHGADYCKSSPGSPPKRSGILQKIITNRPLDTWTPPQEPRSRTWEAGEQCHMDQLSMATSKQVWGPSHLQDDVRDPQRARAPLTVGAQLNKMIQEEMENSQKNGTYGTPRQIEASHADGYNTNNTKHTSTPPNYLLAQSAGVAPKACVISPITRQPSPEHAAIHSLIKYDDINSPQYGPDNTGKAAASRNDYQQGGYYRKQGSQENDQRNMPLDLVKQHCHQIQIDQVKTQQGHNSSLDKAEDMHVERVTCTYRQRPSDQVCHVKGNSRPYPPSNLNSTVHSMSSGQNVVNKIVASFHHGNEGRVNPKESQGQSQRASVPNSKAMTIASYVDSILTSVYLDEQNDQRPTHGNHNVSIQAGPPHRDNHNAGLPAPPHRDHHNAVPSHRDNHNGHAQQQQVLPSSELLSNHERISVEPSGGGDVQQYSTNGRGHNVSLCYMNQRVAPPRDNGLNTADHGHVMHPGGENCSPNQDNLSRPSESVPTSRCLPPQHEEIGRSRAYPQPEGLGDHTLGGPPSMIHSPGSRSSQSPYGDHGDGDGTVPRASSSSVCSSDGQMSVTDHDVATIGSPGNFGEEKVTPRLCQICNDTASGFHYGVWSCEGCKAFFKRSLQGPTDYVCPATNNCTIDKHRRKSCQACRLRKCTEMGMSRGTCREKKTYRQYHRNNMKRKSPSSPDCEVVSPKQYRPTIPNSPDNHKGLVEPIRIKKEPQVCPVQPLVERPANQTAQQVPQDIPPIHPLVEHLMKTDPPVRFANPHMHTSQSTILETILKLTDIELMDIVAWAKGVPGYMDMPLGDRMNLLEMSWMEILLLGLVWRSMPHHDLLAFAPDLQVTHDSLAQDDLGPVCHKLLVLVSSARSLSLEREELVLLRACVLLNAGVTNLSNDAKFMELQTQIQEALHYTTVTRHRHSVARTTRLLLLLPQLRQISMEFIAYLSTLKDSSKLPTNCNLISEILSNQRALKAQLW